MLKALGSILRITHTYTTQDYIQTLFLFLRFLNVIIVYGQKQLTKYILIGSIYFFFFETGSFYAAQVGCELTM
jgi:hypothetical protein